MRFLTGVFLACVFVLPAHADTDREARLAVARDYVEITMKTMDMQEFIRQLWQPMVEQMAAARQPLSEDQIAQIEALFSSELTEPMTEVMRKQDAIMADLMTLEELTALRDFFLSEHGRSAMKKMPELSRIQQPMISAVLQEKMPIMMPKIEAITTAPKQ